MKLDTSEILAALAAGLLAGIVLSFLQTNFPDLGVRRV